MNRIQKATRVALVLCVIVMLVNGVLLWRSLKRETRRLAEWPEQAVLWADIRLAELRPAFEDTAKEAAGHE